MFGFGLTRKLGFKSRLPHNFITSKSSSEIRHKVIVAFRRLNDQSKPTLDMVDRPVSS